VLNGDKEAFRGIVAEYGQGIRAFLAARTDDPSVVDDLAQETFIAAYESLGTFDRDANLGAWLRGIANNKYRMHLRHASRQRNLLERYRREAVAVCLSENPEVLDDMDSALVEKLRKCLEELPDRLREVVHGRYFEKTRVNEIAGRMDTSVSAVSSLLFRGRKQLETCIERTR